MKKVDFHLGHSIKNDCWFVRYHGFKTRNEAQAFAAAMAPQDGLRAAFLQGAMACQVRCEDKGLKGGAEVCAEVITEWLLNGVTERLAATPAAQTTTKIK